MDADELDDLLDGLPAAVQWTPSSCHFSPPPSKPARFAHVFHVNPTELLNGSDAHAASAAIAQSLASVPGRVPTLADAEWALAKEAAAAYREVDKSESKGSAKFIDLSTGMRVRCYSW